MRAGLNPWPRRAARTSASVLSTILSRMHSSCEGPGMLASVLAPRAGLLWLGLFRGCGTVVDDIVLAGSVRGDGSPS